MTLVNDFDLSTEEKVLSQGIHRRKSNMIVLSLTIQK